MTKVTIVFCSCGSEEEALRLARTLVERRLAACVNVLPAAQSVFRWEHEIQTANEYLLLAKTTEERFEALAIAITELHSYDLPEIIALPVSTGSEKFLAWIAESV